MSDKTETVSEKPKRGRPRKAIHRVFDRVPMIHDEITTERGRQNINYRQLGLELLSEDEDAFKVAAGISMDGMRSGKTPAKGWQGLFQEVGRCAESRGFDDWIKSEIIRFVKTQQGKRQSEIKRSLREWRLGVSNELTAQDVATKILKLVDTIRRDHPETSLETVRKALDTSLVIVSDYIHNRD